MTRSNLLAYNLDTGTLQTTFVANLNAQAKTVTASPDGKRLYVGGDFTTVNGVPRRYVAALNPTTGAPLAEFAPSLNSQVKAIAATSQTVYLGGSFTTVNGNSKSRLAAVTTTGGLLASFAPVVEDGAVQAMVISPGGTRLVVGGSFTKLNRSANPGYGLGQSTRQQGLVRFATKEIAPNKQGLRATGGEFQPVDDHLGVGVLNRPTRSATLTEVSPGPHSYKVSVRDSFGNTVTSVSVSRTVT